MRIPKKTKGTKKLSVSTGNGRPFVSLPPSTLPSAPAPSTQPLTPETIETGYVSPLIDLWTEQSSLGSNPYPHPRRALLRGQLKSLKQDNVKQGREGFADRAVGKLGDFRRKAPRYLREIVTVLLYLQSFIDP
jgi:hypothetical protein